MNSMFSTVINFGMLGLLRRVHRLQIQSKLQAESSETNIIFPQKQKHEAKSGTNSLSRTSLLSEITDSDIAEAIVRSKIKAREKVEALGMIELY